MISFKNWLLEQINTPAPMGANGQNSSIKKDDDRKMQATIKSALVNAMKQKQDPKKALNNVASQAAMNPNASAKDILNIKKIADEIDSATNNKMQKK